MRKFMLISLTVLALAAIGISITGPACAQAARVHAMHRFVLAMRSPGILV